MFLNIGKYLELKKFIKEDNYICPNPSKWLELFHILQKAPIHNNELKLEAPLLNEEWESSTTTQKRKRFQDELEYAFKNACLGEVDIFLRSLKEDEWLRGEST